MSSTPSQKPGAILLVRHGKPALSRDVRLSARGYRRWWDDSYEPGGLRAGEEPPAHVIGYAKGCVAVFTSVRRRAIESAVLVRADVAAVQDPDLIEAPLPTPPLPEAIKVGPRVWGFIARFIWWFFGYHSGQESRKQAEVRADRAVGKLIEAARGGDVIVVAHGFFNVMLGRALRKQGWVRVERRGMLHWNSRRFERSTEIRPNRPARLPAMSDAAAPKTNEDISALSFEDALAELEKIVGELESGQAPLERSIEIYQRGAALKAHCEKKLEAARLKVEKIVVGGDGQPKGAEPADFS